MCTPLYPNQLLIVFRNDPRESPSRPVSPAEMGKALVSNFPTKLLIFPHRRTADVRVYRTFFFYYYYYTPRYNNARGTRSLPLLPPTVHTPIKTVTCNYFFFLSATRPVLCQVAGTIITWHKSKPHFFYLLFQPRFSYVFP